MRKELKKIIHVPLEIAGQVGLICEFLRMNGYHAVAYNYFQTYLNYRKVIHTDAFELIKILDPAIRYYDLFHFHNSYSFMEGHKDIDMIASRGKKMIMHHRGNDVRFRKRAYQWKGYNNPYVNTESSFPDEQIDRNLRFFAKMMCAAIVQDYELYEYVIDYYAAEGKKVYILPRLINVELISPVYSTEKHQVPLVIHAPTNRAFKGSDIIEKVVSYLQKEYSFEYQSIEKKSHREALELYRQADIVIDQVLCGAYGNFSVEAMALGKPVICYIRPDLKTNYPPELPILSANPDTLYDVLKDLLRQPEQWPYLGKKGRAYVEKHHSAKKNIRQLIRIYKEVGEK